MQDQVSNMTVNPLLLSTPIKFHKNNEWRSFDLNMESNPSARVDPQLKLFTKLNEQQKGLSLSAENSNIYTFKQPQLLQPPLAMPNQFYTGNGGVKPSKIFEASMPDTASSGTKCSTPSSRTTSLSSLRDNSTMTSHNTNSTSPPRSVTSSKRKMPARKIPTRKTPARKSKQQQKQKQQEGSEEVQPTKETAKRSQPKRHRSGSDTTIASAGDFSKQRNKTLERNRIAASRCRQKKKEWVGVLEETESEIEAQHMALQVEVGRLQHEVTMVKEMLTAHAGCQDPNINRWVEHEAARFVKNSAASHQARNQAANSLQSLNVTPVCPIFDNKRIKKSGTNFDFMTDEIFNDETL